jgi:hypothetical protein
VTDQRGVEAGVQVLKSSIDDLPQKMMVLLELQLRFWSVTLRQHLLKLVRRSGCGGHEVRLNRIIGQEEKLPRRADDAGEYSLSSCDRVCLPPAGTPDDLREPHGRPRFGVGPL